MGWAIHWYSAAACDLNVDFGLAAFADRQQMSQPAYREELANWVHGSAAQRTDGMAAVSESQAQFRERPSGFSVTLMLVRCKPSAIGS